MSRYEVKWDSVDAMGEALQWLRMSGAFYCKSQLTQAWGLEMPPMPGCLWFHAMVSGSCELSGEGFGPLRLGAGDFVLISRGVGHLLRSDASAETPNVLDLPHEMVGERFAQLEYGGPGPADSMICGVVRFENHTARELVRELPPAIHVTALGPQAAESMESTLKLMAIETRRIAPGGEAIVTRLADILVIQAIRTWLQNDPAARQGWLGALQDKQIGRALALIHRNPAAEWTVASLAAEAAMSRSAFAARFTSLVNQTPIQYLSRVRMKVASEMLAAEDGLKAGDLAARVGYQSEGAFRRAFKRFEGKSLRGTRRPRLQT